MREDEWAAFAFGFGLDEVREGFRAAIEGCDTRGMNARRDSEVFLESHSSFGEDSPQHYHLMDLAHSEWLADSAKTVIREAFILSAFHYWERRMRAWTNCKGRGFPSLSMKAKASGYPSDDRLRVVNTLCNLLKHDTAEYALELGKEWPELFEELPSGPQHEAQWVLSIKDQHVEEVFNIVGRSAPQIAPA